MKSRIMAWGVAGLLAVFAAGESGADVISTNFGMSYYFATTHHLPNLNNPNTLTSYRFTCPEDIEVDQFAFTMAAAVGSPDVHISVQTDNDGVPSGTILAEATFTPPESGSTHFYHGNFAAAAQLTNGAVYHVVRTVTNGDADNRITLVQHSNAHYPDTIKTGSPDPQQSKLDSTNGGTSWTAANQLNGGVNNVLLGNSSGGAVGMPWTQGVAFGAGGVTKRGQRFVYTGLTGDKITNVNLRVAKGAGDAADDLRLYIMTDAGGILSSNVFLSAGFTDTTAQIYSLVLDEPVTLTAGTAYRIGLESEGSTGNSYNLATIGSQLTNSLWGATFQGLEGYAIAGSVLTNMPNASSATVQQNMYFMLGIEVIPEPTTALLALLGLLLMSIRRRPS